MKILEFSYKGELHFFVTDKLSFEQLVFIKQLFAQECEDSETINKADLAQAVLEKLGITIIPTRIDYVIAV